MATLEQKIRCERSARTLIENEGLPEPDRIEYGYTCIRLFWFQTRTALVIDIDGPDALAEAAELATGSGDRARPAEEDQAAED